MKALIAGGTHGTFRIRLPALAFSAHSVICRLDFLQPEPPIVSLLIAI
jgi:hypothetical protein